MKIIEVDEELYQYIAAQTQSIGESASDILRRLLNLPIHATSSYRALLLRRCNRCSVLRVTGLSFAQSSLQASSKNRGHHILIPTCLSSIIPSFSRKRFP